MRARACVLLILVFSYRKISLVRKDENSNSPCPEMLQGKHTAVSVDQNMYYTHYTWVGLTRHHSITLTPGYVTIPIIKFLAVL